MSKKDTEKTTTMQQAMGPARRIVRIGGEPERADELKEWLARQAAIATCRGRSGHGRASRFRTQPDRPHIPTPAQGGQHELGSHRR